MGLVYYQWKVMIYKKLNNIEVNVICDLMVIFVIKC